MKGEAQSAAAGCSQLSPGSVLVKDPVWDGVSAPRKGHIHMLFAVPSWCYFPWYSQSLGLVLHGTSLGWMAGSSPALLCLPASRGHLLLPGVGVLGAALNVGLWLWHSQDCWSLWDRARAAGRKLPYLHGGQDRDEFTRLHIT